MKVLILHPDLGIGGAERLILDIALALKYKKYEIDIITNHYDVNHSFKETKSGQLPPIKVIGDWIPRKMFGNHFYALYAYLRFLYLTFYVILNQIPADLIICDQIPIGIPFLKLFKYKVLFYCHFPDLMLTDRRNMLKKIYRYPIDMIEEISMSYADKILVNSKFTASIVQQTFVNSSMANRNLDVLYPCVSESCSLNQDTNLENPFNSPKEYIFLSINRYEKKKQVELAIKAYKELIEYPGSPVGCRQKSGLIIAGGYDDRVPENAQCFKDLNCLASECRLEIGNDIIFLKSVTDDTKQKLLKACSALLYTPTGEHFGIVPLEASAQGKPVIAVNDGGPRETVIHGKTGFLCDPYPSAFAAAMLNIIRSMDSLDGEGGDLPETYCYVAKKDVLGEHLDPRGKQGLISSSTSVPSSLDSSEPGGCDFEKLEISAADTWSADVEGEAIKSRDCIDHVERNFSFRSFADKLAAVVEGLLPVERD